MNRIAVLLLICSCLFGNKTLACCDPTMSVPFKMIDNNYQYLKSYNIDSHNDRKKIYYTMVLSAGTSYQFVYYNKNIYQAFSGDYLVEILAYDHKASKSKKIDDKAATEVIHQFVIKRSPRTGSTKFYCSKTGIYLLKVPNAKGICAGIAMAYSKSKHWLVEIDISAEKNKSLNTSWISFPCNLKEDEEGYILIEAKHEDEGIDWKYRYYLRGKSRKTIIKEITRGIYKKYGMHVDVTVRYFK